MTIQSQASNVVITGNLPTGVRYSGEYYARHEDQASRLRSMVDALQGHPAPAAQTRPAAAPPPPRPAPARHCPVIAITSGKGGVGKTSTCVNLAIALSQAGHRAALLDADLGLANADVMCGITPTTRLDSVLELKSDGAAQPRRGLAQIAVDAPGGFRLVPGSVGIRKMANLAPNHRQTIFNGLAELESGSDVVLVDTGAGLGDAVTSFAAAADLTLVVATPEPTSIADAYAMIKCIAQIRAAIAPKSGFRTALIINQASSLEEGRAVHGRIAATCKRFLGIEPPLLGIIHQDPAIPAAVRARTPLLIKDPSCRASKDLRALGESLSKLLNLKAPELASRPKKSLLGWLRGR